MNAYKQEVYVRLSAYNSETTDEIWYRGTTLMFLEII
jgi:hypothetical protein